MARKPHTLQLGLTAALIVATVFTFGRETRMLPFFIFEFSMYLYLRRYPNRKILMFANCLLALAYLVVFIAGLAVIWGFIVGQIESTPELTTSPIVGAVEGVKEAMWLAEQFAYLPDKYLPHFFNKTKKNELNWVNGTNCTKYAVIVEGWLEQPTAAINTQNNLLSLGYCSVAISMRHRLTRYKEHVKNLNETLTNIVNQVGNIVVIPHSYGCPLTMRVMVSNQQVREATTKVAWLTCAHRGTRMVTHLNNSGVLPLITSGLGVVHTLDLQDGSEFARENIQNFSLPGIKTLSLVSKSDTIVVPREWQELSGTPTETADCAHNRVYEDATSQSILLSFVADRPVVVEEGYRYTSALIAFALLMALIRWV
eukprot:m.186363 g.186363  ORF g.186363 m.186363 type:complete len:369 (-) comp15590_c0_seq12:2119-3225(-)